MRVLESEAAAGGLLADGGVVLMPTDTIPGLHCRADRPEAVARIVAMKERPADKPFALLCASRDQALLLTLEPPDPVTDYMAKCWPGSFTLIMKASALAPATATGGGDSVALRVPAPAALRRLVAAAGFPLISTSANRAGGAVCRDVTAAQELFGESVDGVLLELLPPLPPPTRLLPSGLLDLTRWPPRLLREGPLPAPPWQRG